jgi:hypothetical protein
MSHALILFLLLMASSVSAQDPQSDRYQVRFETGLKAVAVRACFAGTAPKRLYHHSTASRFSGGIDYPGGHLALRRDSRSVTLPDLPPDSCLEWRVDLAGAAAGRDQQLAIRIDNDLLMSANLWFWKGRQQRPVQVSVTVPPGMSFSTPWPRSTNTGDAWEYVPRPTSSSWKARIAVGRFPLQLIKSPGTEITLAALGDLSPSVNGSHAGSVTRSRR